MIHIYESPYKLKDTWEVLYASSAHCTPFQSYNTNESYYLVYSLKGSHRKYKPIFVLHEDGENKCIIPLLVGKATKIVRNFSSFGPIDYYNVIASSYEISYLQQVLREVLALYSDYELIFENIPEHSALCGALKNIQAHPEICVMILLDRFDSADSYFQSLSKHQRQNIRTAYNRLKRDNMSYSISVYDKQHPMPYSLRSQYKAIYADRYEAKNHLEHLHWFKKKLMRVVRRIQDPLDDIIARDRNHAIYVLSLNNNPVAFMAGFYNRAHDTFYVPRLTYDMKYVAYDAGILLVYEVIKLLKSENVACLDLTRGDEPYKYAMGGEEHYNYTFIAKEGEILKGI